METLDFYSKVRITYDPDYPNKIEIAMLEDGVIVEGGQFDLGEFMNTVLEFYNERY